MNSLSKLNICSACSPQTTINYYYIFRTTADDSNVLCMTAESEEANIEKGAFGNSSFTSTAVESMAKDASHSRSVFPRCDRKSFLGVPISNLPADDLSVSVVPESVLAEGTPLSSSADLYSAFKLIPATSQPDLAIDTG